MAEETVQRQVVAAVRIAARPGALDDASWSADATVLRLAADEVLLLDALDAGAPEPDAIVFPAMSWVRIVLPAASGSEGMARAAAWPAPSTITRGARGSSDNWRPARATRCSSEAASWATKRQRRERSFEGGAEATACATAANSVVRAATARGRRATGGPRHWRATAARRSPSARRTPGAPRSGAPCARRRIAVRCHRELSGAAASAVPF